MGNNFVFKSKAHSKVLTIYNKYMLIFTEYPEDEDVQVEQVDWLTTPGKVKFTCVGFNISTQVSMLIKYELYPCELTLSQYIKMQNLEELAAYIYSEAVYDGYDMPEIPYNDNWQGG